ncbi:hypothetical protein [Chlorobium limicola]|uniref:hypothetical protein n=1 Tax=Chlorobium limicola TaxID=1092 RepID=UPI0023F22E9F|nr:hypothetical protein [Chlorobium limicola]
MQKMDLELQHESLVQLKEELTESLDRYTGLFDSAAVGYLRLARDNSIPDTNLTGARMLGVDSHLLNCDRFGRFIFSEDKPVFNDRPKGCSAGKRSVLVRSGS